MHSKQVAKLTRKGQLLLVLRVDNMPEDDFIHENQPFGGETSSGHRLVHENRPFGGESGEKLEIKWGEMVTEL